MDNSQSSLQLNARRHQGEVNERRRQMLAPVAVALRNPVQAPSVIAAAHRQVSLWRNGKLCSGDYIRAWEDLLQHPERAAAVLEDQSPKAAQLRQNSPFAEFIRSPSRLLHAA